MKTPDGFSEASPEELLSAWMDGELPDEQARFLQRRLQHDAALRERWERWQLAAACLRGQAVMPVDEGLAARVQLALQADTTPAMPMRKRALPWVGWGLAASLGLALAWMPGFVGSPGEHNAIIASEVASVPQVMDTSMAVSAVELPPVERLAASSPPAPTSPVAATREDPLPALNATGKSKPWPRSPLIGREDAAISDYLVRHSGLMAEAGLGGVLPEADVIVHDIRPAALEAPAADGTVVEEAASRR